MPRVVELAVVAARVAVGDQQVRHLDAPVGEARDRSRRRRSRRRRGARSRRAPGRSRRRPASVDLPPLSAAVGRCRHRRPSGRSPAIRHFRATRWTRLPVGRHNLGDVPTRVSVPDPPLARRAQPAAARGRGAPGQPAADRGRRRVGQDAGAHPPHRLPARPSARCTRARSWRSPSPTRPPREMKERVDRLVGPRSKAMWVMTFHSACVRILRREAKRLGLHVELLDLRPGRLAAADGAGLPRPGPRPEALPAAVVLRPGEQPQERAGRLRDRVASRAEHPPGEDARRGLPALPAAAAPRPARWTSTT